MQLKATGNLTPRYSLFATLLFSILCNAEQIVISDEGREVLIKDDGSWQYVSRDRYASDSLGRRIVLKPDGSWQYKDDAIDNPVQAERSAVQDEPGVKSQLPGSRLLLDRVEVQRKLTKTIKSKRLETRTIYFLQIRNTGSQDMQLEETQLQRIAKGMRAGSSGGENFEIIAVESGTKKLAPGDSSELLVRTAGSPKWFNVKFLELEIAGGVLGNPAALVLRKDMDEIDIVRVDDF